MIGKQQKLQSSFSISLILAILCLAGSVYADAPVSLGTKGALERGLLTQDSTRGGNSATFGTPSFDEDRGFSLRWRIPLFLYGAEADAANSALSTIIPMSNRFRNSYTSSLISTAFDNPVDVFFGEENGTKLSNFIPAMRIGDEGNPFHIQIGALNYNMGHGSQVYKFTNSPQGGSRRMGLLLELNAASLGTQVAIGNIDSATRFISGRIYGRPILWLIAPDSILQPNGLDLDPRVEAGGIWKTGISGVYDNGSQADSIVNASQLNPSWAVGWDNELALVDTKFLELQGYLDLNLLSRPKAVVANLELPFDIAKDMDIPLGIGMHPGAKINLHIPMLFDFTAEGDYNVGSDGYIPRYFDQLYYLERKQAVGARQAKGLLDAPASQGYRLKMSANFMKMLSLFVESQDQFAFQASRGTNSGSLTMGASLFFAMVGMTATVSQTGIRNYFSPNFFGTGFIATVEGRVTLLANVLHLVGRYYRVHDPVDPNLIYRDYNVNEGALLGLELNFDIDTPLPIW